MLKTNLLGLMSSFSKCYFKTGTICFFFLSSHVFTALEYDSNHFGILLCKIVKPRDHNEIKPLTEKYAENINQSDIILWCPENNCCTYFKLLCSIITRYPTSKGIRKYYNLGTTFQKKVNFSQYIRFIRSYYLTTFQPLTTLSLRL